MGDYFLFNLIFFNVCNFIFWGHRTWNFVIFENDLIFGHLKKKKTLNQLIS